MHVWGRQRPHFTTIEETGETIWLDQMQLHQLIVAFTYHRRDVISFWLWSWVVTVAYYRYVIWELWSRPSYPIGLAQIVPVFTHIIILRFTFYTTFCFRYSDCCFLVVCLQFGIIIISGFVWYGVITLTLFSYLHMDSSWNCRMITKIWWILTPAKAKQ